MSAVQWKAGTADVRAVRGLHVIVACPHCYGTHQHGRGCIGSTAVVAGCHTGFARCREYAIPGPTNRSRTPRPAR